MASSSWDKRNAMARAKGYRNYYDYRVHQYGKRPAGEPVEKGHREGGKKGAAALRRAVKRGNVALIVEVPTQSAGGQWSRMSYIATFTDGRIEEYSLPVVLDDEYPDLDDWLDYWHDLFDEYDIDFVEYATAPGAQAAA